MGNILAISSLLDNFYKSRGCNTVTVPTILDMEAYKEVSATEHNYGNVIHVAYAGNPGKKDYIINAILALELLSEDERKHICFDLYGPSEKEISSCIPPTLIQKFQNNIVCHGRIPHEDVKKKIANADFTVLLRPDKRYANAGFPTKVGESMACGTPVIANITSDLGRYIIDGKTGIVCENETIEAFADAVRRVLAMSDRERALMRNEASRMAENSFDYKVYADALDDYIKRITQR